MVDPEFLKDVPLFQTLARTDLEQLAEIMREVEIPAGKVLFEVGDPGSTMYVIKRGGVRITLPDRGGTEVVLASLGSGEFFGELALLDGEPRSARATAIEETTLFSLAREDFLHFIETRPQTALVMLAANAKRLRHTDELMRTRAAYDVNAELDKAATFGERIADRLAKSAGSWTFVGVYLVAVLCWIGLQLWMAARGRTPFDEYPFQFLGFLLGVLASLQAPVILMAQNRDETRDRFRADADFKVNLKNEVGIERTLERLDELRRQLGEVRRQAKEQELAILKQAEALAALAAEIRGGAAPAGAAAGASAEPPSPALSAQLPAAPVPAGARRWSRGVGKPK